MVGTAGGAKDAEDPRVGVKEAGVEEARGAWRWEGVELRAELSMEDGRRMDGVDEGRGDAALGIPTGAAIGVALDGVAP
jgi:hypothetical protein